MVLEDLEWSPDHQLENSIWPVDTHSSYHGKLVLTSKPEDVFVGSHLTFLFNRYEIWPKPCNKDEVLMLQVNIHLTIKILVLSIYSKVIWFEVVLQTRMWYLVIKKMLECKHLLIMINYWRNNWLTKIDWVEMKNL